MAANARFAKGGKTEPYRPIRWAFPAEQNLPDPQEGNVISGLVEKVCGKRGLKNDWGQSPIFIPFVEDVDGVAVDAEVQGRRLISSGIGL